MKYIDLGLPSGTLWAVENEEGYYSFDDAVEKYDNSLPTIEQFKELRDKCQWEWIDNGYKVTGPNGNSIVLPAESYRNSNGNVNYVGSYGYYWSSTHDGAYDYNAMSLYFGYSGPVCMCGSHRRIGMPVRLIKER